MFVQLRSVFRRPTRAALIKCRYSSTSKFAVGQRYLDTLIEDGKFNWINGSKHVDLDAKSHFENVAPRTGRTLCVIPNSDQKCVDDAFRSAHHASHKWRRMTSRERGDLLLKTASILRRESEKIAFVDTIDNGKPMWESIGDMDSVISCLEHFGHMACDHSSILNVGEYIRLSKPFSKDDSFAYVTREPFGVVGAIGAWNYPLQTLAWKAAPALACGNTVVFKPSPLTPLTALSMGEAMKEAGVPDGVMNVVQGDGETTGQLMCEHDLCAKLTFTGSVPTGTKIMEAASKRLCNVSLELGGKSPLILFDDAKSVDLCVRGALAANFLTQGAVCSNATRIFVHNKIHDEFLEKFVKATENLKIGDPLHESTRIGATISEDHANKVLSYVRDAVHVDNAKLETGGSRIILDGDLEQGHYLSPCILSNCVDSMSVVRHEVFGAVASVLKFDGDEEEVIDRANSTPFGLAGGVYSSDLAKAHRVSQSLNCGTVWINCYNLTPVNVPFGGFKRSGIGRENGSSGAVECFTQQKTVYVGLDEVNDGNGCSGLLS